VKDHVALFPLPSLVSFPGVAVPLRVFEPRYRMMVRDALISKMEIGLVLLAPGWEMDYYGNPALRSVGVSGPITHFEEVRKDLFEIRIESQRRFRILAEVQAVPYRIARVERLQEDMGDLSRGETWSALHGIKQELLGHFEEYRRRLTGRSRPDSPLKIATAALVNLMCFYSRATPEQKQELLELPVLERARELSGYLREDLESLSKTQDPFAPDLFQDLGGVEEGPTHPRDGKGEPQAHPAFRVISGTPSPSEDGD